MSRRKRGNVDHSVLKNLSEGMEGALNKVREMGEDDLDSNQEVEERVKAPSALKDLVLFGKVEEEVSVGGFTFKMSTLTNREQQTLVKELVKLEDEERLMNVKMFTLAMSITSVNGSPISHFVSSDSESEFMLAVSLLNEMQSNLVNHLYDQYELIVQKSNSFFKDGELGEHIKN